MPPVIFQGNGVKYKGEPVNALQEQSAVEKVRSPGRAGKDEAQSVQGMAESNAQCQETTGKGQNLPASNATSRLASSQCYQEYCRIVLPAWVI